MHRPEPQTRRGSSRAGPGSSQEPGPSHDPCLAQRQAFHDAANWLTVLLGHVEALREDPSSSRHLELARRAARAAHRLCALPPGLPSTSGALDAARHLRRLALHAGPAAREAGVALRVEVEELPPLRADLPGFEDAVMNLVRNALEATPRGGAILLGLARAPGGFGRVWVEDDGPGIPDDARGRIGEPGSSGKLGVDRGLGLARVRDWLAAVGARLEIGDAASGGASVGFVLPIVDGTLPRAPARRGGLRVLLVEDDLAVAEVLTLLLQSDGHHVEHQADFESAEEVFCPGSFDLALCDQNLPDGAGEDLVAAFAAQDDQVVCFVVTGAPESVHSGADRRVGVLAKPVSREDLRRAAASASPVAPRPDPAG